MGWLHQFACFPPVSFYVYGFLLYGFVSFLFLFTRTLVSVLSARRWAYTCQSWVVVPVYLDDCFTAGRVRLELRLRGPMTVMI
jgi:hypothetical protein